MKNYFFILVILSTCIANAGACTCFRRPLKDYVIKNDTLPDKEKTVFFKARILNLNSHTLVPFNKWHVVDIKIIEYWSKNDLQLKNDTLALIVEIGPCGNSYFKDSINLIMSKLEDGIYKDYGCSGTDLFSSYSSDISVLGKAGIIEIKKSETPDVQPVKTGKKNMLILWLVVSLLLNFFAILLIVLLKKEKL